MPIVDLPTVNTDAPQGECRSAVGLLYIVATPIGHLGDMSVRAIETLKHVHCILAEDTRHAAKLLQHYQIKTPCVSLHEHNEVQRVDSVLGQLQAGEAIALISDAGTPLISDPGFRLVAAAQAKGLCVMPIPGACAAIAALCVSGLPTDRFVFEGFLPTKSQARCRRLEGLKEEVRTIIVYESCHRVVASLQDIQQVFGAQRWVVVARELTKLFESVHSGTCEQLVAHFQQVSTLKGEYVILLKGFQAPDEAPELSSVETRYLRQMKPYFPPRQLAQMAQHVFEGRKKQYYQWLICYKEE